MITTYTWFNIPIIYYCLLLALILLKIPILGKFFQIIGTLLHEFGHAFMTLLLQGKVHSIEIFGNTSGSATTQTKNKFSSFLVAGSGYLFTSSFAWISFYLLASQLYSYFILGLSILFFLILLLWVRNRFGVFWIIAFCLINALLLYYISSDIVIATVALFYASVILVESVVSTLTLLYLSFFRHKEAGDAYSLQQITRIPALFWALLFTIYAGFVAYKIFDKFIFF